MAPLTEEQRERIRINRERALEIQRRKREERERQQQQHDQEQQANCSVKRKTDDETEKILDNVASKKSQKTTDDATPYNGTKIVSSTTTSFLDDGLPIEPFEEGASEWVTKKDAMNIYCLTEGTLAVLHVEERENPQNKLWKPMKLYRRSDVRKWAHKRWNGLQNLQAERERRQMKKLQKEMKDADDIFK